tara:strand:- start:678 stop:953 length:276 start_codon:yes stop_codon:yes gene_type:complete
MRGQPRLGVKQKKKTFWDSLGDKVSEVGGYIAHAAPGVKDVAEKVAAGAGTAAGMLAATGIGAPVAAGLAGVAGAAGAVATGAGAIDTLAN